MHGTAKNKRDAIPAAIDSAVMNRMVIKSIAGVGPKASSFRCPLLLRQILCCNKMSAYGARAEVACTR